MPHNSQQSHKPPHEANSRPDRYRLLLVEDDPHHQELIRRRVERTAEAKLEFVACGSLADALAKLGREDFDAVLLDLVLPDSPINHTLAAVIDSYPAVPVVVLTSLDDLDFAAITVQQGAQDYLVKSQLTSETLVRSVRYAVERKKIQEANRQYMRELERSNEQLKQFAHTVAHELKSPLNVVSLCLSLLEFQSSAQSESDSLGEDGREAIAEAQQGVNGMAALVDELLNFAQVEQLQTKTAVELDSVFQQAVAALRPDIQSTGAKITCEPLPRVLGEPLQLRHVLQNLMGNAIKYRDHRLPEIHIGVQREADRWLITVRDNGIGIPADHLGRVFDMFYRIQNDGGPQGTGIGLAFCRRIIELHDGEIWAESLAPEGSQFCFTLPVARSECNLSNEQASGNPRSGSERPDSADTPPPETACGDRRHLHQSV